MGTQVEQHLCIKWYDLLIFRLLLSLGCQLQDLIIFLWNVATPVKNGFQKEWKTKRFGSTVMNKKLSSAFIVWFLKPFMLHSSCGAKDGGEQRHQTLFLTASIMRRWFSLRTWFVGGATGSLDTSLVANAEWEHARASRINPRIMAAKKHPFVRMLVIFTAFGQLHVEESQPKNFYKTRVTSELLLWNGLVHVYR